MRLTLAISTLGVGGAERVLSMLANAWVVAGHDVSLVTTHDAGAGTHYALDPRVRRLAAGGPGRGLRKQLSVVAALRRLVGATRPDVVVSFLNYTNVLVLLACRGTSVPVIVSERLDPRVVGIGPVWGAFRRLTYRRAAALVAQTPTAGRALGSLAPGRLHVIPNPVQRPATREYDARADRDGHTILCVGRLHPQKGFDVALQALARLEGEARSWRLVILGEGAERARLAALCERLGLDGRVAMPGQVPDPWPWLRAADIFLLPSRSEGFPNALCEAMAAGLPVVATDCLSGPADIITPEVDGLLTPPGDPDAMAAALTRLIASPDLRAALAGRAPAILDRFSLPSVLAAWDRIFAAVAGGAAA